MRGVWILPLNPGSVDGLLRFQVHHYPLRMQFITLTGKFTCEVGIALPIRQIGTGHRTIATGRKTAMRKGVSQDVFDWLLQFGAAGEVAIFVCWVRPSAVLGRMPCGVTRHCVVPVLDRAHPR